MVIGGVHRGEVVVLTADQGPLVDVKPKLRENLRDLLRQPSNWVEFAGHDRELGEVEGRVEGLKVVLLLLGLNLLNPRVASSLDLGPDLVQLAPHRLFLFGTGGLDRRLNLGGSARIHHFVAVGQTGRDGLEGLELFWIHMPRD